jgi:hypothetical protein
MAAGRKATTKAAATTTTKGNGNDNDEIQGSFDYALCASLRMTAFWFMLRCEAAPQDDGWLGHIVAKGAD